MSVKLQFQSAKNHYILSEKQLNKIIILNSCESSIQLMYQPQKIQQLGFTTLLRTSHQIL